MDILRVRVWMTGCRLADVWRLRGEMCGQAETERLGESL